MALEPTHDASAAEQATIAVFRTSPADVGFREIYVSIDGKRVAVLQYGQRMTRSVAPGPHRVRLHNTLMWKTFDLDLRPGEHVRFNAANRAGWATFSILSLLGAGPLYLEVEREPAAEVQPQS